MKQVKIDSVPRRFEYVGPIQELQGQIALVRALDEQDLTKTILLLKTENTCLAQFDDRNLCLGRTSLGYGWHPFPKSHFVPLQQKKVF